MISKRAIDVVAAVSGLVIAAPVLAGVAVLVQRKLGAPVLFKQLRVGRDGQTFQLYKFRTMRDARDTQGNELPDHERLGPFGTWLRSTSLDELPSLWNVLKGDMSLVGPRPLLVRYLERYTARQNLRHRVRPGITGWAQVNGRNSISWEQKFELDVWYVENQSLALDVRILVMTALRVVRSDGISADGSATMPEFMGTMAAAVTPAGNAPSR